MGGKDAKAKAEAEATHEYEVMSHEWYKLVSKSLDIAVSHCLPLRGIVIGRALVFLGVLIV